MRYLHKVAIAFSIVLLFAPLAHSQTTTRRTAQTHQRTLRPQPRYNAFHSHTFTGVLADVGIRVGTIMAYHQLAWSVTGTVTACQVQLDESSDGINWTASPPIFSSQNCTTSGHPTPQTVNKTTVFIRINMTAFTGTGSVLVDYYGFTSNPGGGGGGGGGGVTSFNGRTGAVVSVGSPTSGDYTCLTSATCMIAGAATLNSPAFNSAPLVTGFPSGPTSTVATPGDNSLATTAFVYAHAGGGGGGTGNVTATPPLTSPFLPKATGATTIADSRFSDTGTLGLYTGGTFGVGAGDTSCGSITGCIALAESTVNGGGTSIGHAYIRADASHALKFANLAGEFFLPRMTNQGNAGQVATANGDGTYTAADPIISVNSGLLFSNASGLSQQTSSPMLNPLRSGYGTLSISPVGTFSTGTCSISLYFNTSTPGAPVLGNTNATPFAVVNFQLNASVPLQSIPIVPDPSVGAGAGGDYVVGVYSCAAAGQNYPGSGAGFSATISPGLTAGPPFTCNRKIIFSSGSVPPTRSLIIDSVPNAKIYVCGWSVNSATTNAVDVQLVYGTGTACGTGTSPFSESITLQALTNSAPVGAVNNAPNNVVDATPYGAQLCAETANGTTLTHPVNWKIWYAQF